MRKQFSHQPPPPHSHSPAATARALVLFALGTAYAAAIKHALVVAVAGSRGPVPHPAVALWSAVGVVAAGAALAAAHAPAQTVALWGAAAVRPAIAGFAWMVGIVGRVAAVGVLDVVPTTVRG